MSQSPACGLEAPGLVPVEALGSESGRRYAAIAWIEGCPASQWVLHHGRLAPNVVGEVARRMVQALLVLEQAGLSHGDVSPHSLLLAPVGNVLLLAPGLRGLVRPTEGYSHAELRPEAYEFLAPERVADAAPAGLLADIYSCGCLWWHLLAGRPPVPGGDSLGKLRAVETAQLVDVRGWAPDVPAVLAQTIAACTQRDPRRRPDSFVRLAAMLGPPASDGQRILREAILGRGRRPSPLRTQRQARQRQEISSRITVALTLLVLLASLAALGWTATRWKKAWKNGTGPISPLATPETGHIPVPPAPEIRPVPFLATRIVDPQVVPASATQRIRPRSGGRETVRVAAEGWKVTAEGATVEDLDFVWAPPSLGESGPAEPGPMVRCEASEVTFLRCTFRVMPTGGPRPAAIGWMRSAESRASDASLPSGRITLRDCVFHGVDAGIDGRTPGATAIHVENTAHVGGGPLLRWSRYPNADEPVTISLVRVTLRDSGPLLACDPRNLPAQPGALLFRASQCVFMPQRDAALILLGGCESPQGPWSAFRWLGEGSLLAPKTPMAVWRDDRGATHVLDDSAVPIAGLVRGDVEFSGIASADPQSSRAVSWQVPLRTPDPPGIDPDRLPRQD